MRLPKSTHDGCLAEDMDWGRMELCYRACCSIMVAAAGAKQGRGSCSGGCRRRGIAPLERRLCDHGWDFFCHHTIRSHTSLDLAILQYAEWRGACKSLLPPNGTWHKPRQECLHCRFLNYVRYHEPFVQGTPTHPAVKKGPRDSPRIQRTSIDPPPNPHGQLKSLAAPLQSPRRAQEWCPPRWLPVRVPGRQNWHDRGA
jgi:hypothetical protein